MGFYGHCIPTQEGLWSIIRVRRQFIRPPTAVREKDVSHWRNMWSMREGLTVVVPLKEENVSPSFLAVASLALSE